MINIIKELLQFLMNFVIAYRFFTVTFILCIVILLVELSKKGGKR